MRFLYSLLLSLVLSLQALGVWSDGRIVKLSDGGTASFFSYNGTVMLISCAHRTAQTPVKVGDKVGFECADGTKDVATVARVAPFDVGGEPIKDVALFTINGKVTDEVVPLKFSTKPLKPGDTVWICGFPMGKDYRARKVRVVSDDGTLWLDAPSIPGESGGPIINEDGFLVGTLSVTTSENRTGCCGRAVAVPWLEGKEVDWGCDEGGCGVSAGVYIGGRPGGGYYRPAPRPYIPAPVGPPPSSPPLPAPPQPINPKIEFDWKEYDKRQAILLEAIAKDKCNCQPTNLTEVNAKLNLILGKLSEQPKPPAPTPLPPDEQHVVIVADHNAPYWPRLAEAIQNCKKTYSGVRDTTLPNFPIGIHPKAVVYRNSVPVRIVEGQYNVEALLSRLSRGEPI